jgi:hypothetical protein
MPAKGTTFHGIRQVRWPVLMRLVSMFMAFQLFMAPLVTTSQDVVSIYKEMGCKPPPIIEEEVVKHVVGQLSCAHPTAPDRILVAQFHQYEEMMLDHPLREVPHQPPRS